MAEIPSGARDIVNRMRTAGEAADRRAMNPSNPATPDAAPNNANVAPDSTRLSPPRTPVSRESNQPPPFPGSGWADEQDNSDAARQDSYIAGWHQRRADRDALLNAPSSPDSASESNLDKTRRRAKWLKDTFFTEEAKWSLAWSVGIAAVRAGIAWQFGGDSEFITAGAIAGLNAAKAGFFETRRQIGKQREALEDRTILGLDLNSDDEDRLNKFRGNLFEKFSAIKDKRKLVGTMVTAGVLSASGWELGRHLKEAGVYDTIGELAGEHAAAVVGTVLGAGVNVAKRFWSERNVDEKFISWKTAKTALVGALIGGIAGAGLDAAGNPVKDGLGDFVSKNGARSTAGEVGLGLGIGLMGVGKVLDSKGHRALGRYTALAGALTGLTATGLYGQDIVGLNHHDVLKGAAGAASNAAGGNGVDNARDVATSTVKATVTRTPRPSYGAPTVTPEATSVPVVALTAETTSTPLSAESPVPTATTIPTETVLPSPTATTIPTETVAPTATVEPTRTLPPTPTVPATNTPLPVPAEAPTQPPLPTVRPTRPPVMRVLPDGIPDAVGNSPSEGNYQEIGFRINNPQPGLNALLNDPNRAYPPEIDTKYKTLWSSLSPDQQDSLGDLVEQTPPSDTPLTFPGAHDNDFPSLKGKIQALYADHLIKPLYKDLKGLDLDSPNSSVRVDKFLSDHGLKRGDFVGDVDQSLKELKNSGGKINPFNGDHLILRDIMMQDRGVNSNEADRIVTATYIYAKKATSAINFEPTHPDMINPKLGVFLPRDLDSWFDDVEEITDLAA